MTDRHLAAEELASWREFLRAHARLTRLLEADLLRTENLSLASYEVLVQLAEAPGHRLRMTDLADALLLSRSGVTRLVGRLEDIGSVVRYPSADDGRGVVAELTEHGLGQLRSASCTHSAGITRHFVSRLSSVQLALLREICAALAGPAPGPSRPTGVEQSDDLVSAPSSVTPPSPQPESSDPLRPDPAQPVNPVQPVPTAPLS